MDVFGDGESLERRWEGACDAKDLCGGWDVVGELRAGGESFFLRLRLIVFYDDDHERMMNED